MMITIPQEDTPLLQTKRQQEEEEEEEEANEEWSTIRWNPRRSGHGMTKWFVGAINPLVIMTVLLVAFLIILGVTLSPRLWSSNSSSSSFRVKPMKASRWRDDETSSSSSALESSSSSASSASTVIVEDEQFLQWEEWKHEITSKRLKADMTDGGDATTDDLELQYDSQVQNWSGGGTNVTTTTSNATATVPTSTTSTANATAFDRWWSNATQLEKEWWEKTRHILHSWEETVVDHTKQAWNETHDHVQDWWEQQHGNKTKASFASVVATTTTTTWVSPFTDLESTHREERKEINYYDTLHYMNTSLAYSFLFYNGNLQHSQHYFTFQQGWDVQINQAYCGVASAAALLNSLVSHNPTILPIDPVYAPYPYATQANLLLTQCVNTHVIRANATFSGVLAAPYGLSLYQVQALLQCYLPPTSVVVQVHHVVPLRATARSGSAEAAAAAHERWLDDIRHTLIDALLQPHSRVLINFDRSQLGQFGRGHFSPLGGYHAGRDAFLLMDVAKYKYPAVWVPLSKLVAAMATIDGCSIWDFPQAQDELAPELLRPTTMELYAQAMTQVKCQAKYRGFIVVTTSDAASHTNNNDS